MGRDRGRLKRVTVPRRIMLLLYDNQKEVDKFEVPELVTQAGISAELDLRQNHVSRALSELQSQQLVFTRTSHIKGKDRRKQVYFLTQKGVTDVQEHVEEVMIRLVMYHTDGGDIREMKVERVWDDMTERIGQRPTPYQFFTQYFDGSEVTVPQETTEDNITRVNVPHPIKFVGRSEEFESALEAMQEPKHTFIIVKSIAGQGKTAFLTHLVYAFSDRHVHWYRVNEWSAPSDILSEWARFLKQTGRSSLFDQLGKDPTMDLQRSLKALYADLSKVRPLLVLDDLHRAGPELIHMLKQMKAQSQLMNRTLVLVASRSKPKFYGTKDVRIENKVFEMELEGLDWDSAQKLLKARNVPANEHQRAFMVTKGHPLALQLYDPSMATGVGDPSVEFESFVGEEVIRDLTGPELEVLKLASIVNRPIHAEAFLIIQDVDQEVLNGLVDRSILRRYKDGAYDVHDLIGSYLSKWMRPDEKQNYLSMACDHYATRGSDDELIEYMRLLEEVGRKDELVRTLLDNGEYLYSRGYSQVAELVDQVREEQLSNMDKVRYLVLRSDIATSTGRTPSAKHMLDRALGLCDSMLEKGKKAERERVVRYVSRIYTRLAELSKKQGNKDQITQAHKKSVRMNRKYGDGPGLGKALNNLAMAYQERNELDLALNTFLEALKVFEQTDDETAMALVEVNIGEVYLLKRDYAHAKKYLNRARNVPSRYLPAKGAIYHKIGLANMRMGKWRAARSTLDQAKEALSEGGNKHLQLKCINDLFTCAFVLEDEAEGAICIMDGDKIVHEIGDTDAIETTKGTYFLNVVRFSSIWEKDNINTALDRLMEHIDGLVPKQVLEFVETIPQKLKGPVANEVYSATMDNLEKYDDLHPFVIVGIKRATFLMDAGRKSEATKVLSKVRPVAKRIGFKKALSRIDEFKAK